MPLIRLEGLGPKLNKSNYLIQRTYYTIIIYLDYKSSNISSRRMGQILSEAPENGNFSQEKNHLRFSNYTSYITVKDETFYRIALLNYQWPIKTILAQRIAQSNGRRMLNHLITDSHNLLRIYRQKMHGYRSSVIQNTTTTDAKSLDNGINQQRFII